MLGFRLALCVPIAALLGASPPNAFSDPLGFFEGRTVSDSVMKVVMKKPVSARSIGHGRMERDGSLTLVQQVIHDGKPQKQRHWRVRRADGGGFTATMNEAVGPVTIDRVGEAYRFRFRMKNQLSVEQWVKPQANGAVARTTMKVKKLGVLVATSDGTIRKVA